MNLCHHAIISVKHWGMYATMDFSSLPSSQNGFIRDIGVIEAISVLTMWSCFSIERKRMWRNGEQNGIQNVFIILHEFASVLCSSRFMLSSKQIRLDLPVIEFIIYAICYHLTFVCANEKKMSLQSIICDVIKRSKMNCKKKVCLWLCALLKFFKKNFQGTYKAFCLEDKCTRNWLLSGGFLFTNLTLLDYQSNFGEENVVSFSK